MTAYFKRGRICVERRAGLEHADLRREREQILREPVVDLARNPRPLLGDGSPELGAADRTPDADEQDDEREDAQKVALEDVVTRSSGREDVVQIGEDDQRESKREPAVEIAPVAAIPQPEADDRNE